MKKLLVLLTLVVGIIGFSTGVFAADVCTSCKGDTYSKVPCTGTEQSTCSPFNYQTGQGYCSWSGNHVIFAICNCADAGVSFIAGQRIGIRMTILVNGVAGERGAYWADPASDNVRFALHASVTSACDAQTIYTSQFGPGTFYKSDRHTVATPYAGSTCKIESANQATVLVTNPANGYIISASDELNKLSYWNIEIPRIRIDPAVLYNGELISVKIETLIQDTGGICADCVASCECIVVVAQACCAGSSFSCTFPYFTSLTAPTATNNFWNGISIVNTSTKVGTATLYAYENDGTTNAHTKTVSIPAKGMFVDFLENITFTPAVTGGTRAYIKVTADFDVDGFAMMGQSIDAGDSMGYLCRK
jgi:hypothetical protein